MNTKDKYEVYKIQNLPLPINHTPMRQTYPLTKYKLESEMLLVSKDKTKFSFLTETMYLVCNSKHLQLCNPETAFYQTNINKYCIVALFMQNVHDINTFCKQMVVLDERLPITKYLSNGGWIVITNTPLIFTLNCKSDGHNLADIKVWPSFGIIKLNNTCKASNKYLQLPEYFGKESFYERSDSKYAKGKMLYFPLKCCIFQYTKSSCIHNNIFCVCIIISS